MANIVLFAVFACIMIIGSQATCDGLNWSYYLTCYNNYMLDSATVGTDVTKLCNAFHKYTTCVKDLGCVGRILKVTDLPCEPINTPFIRKLQTKIRTTTAEWRPALNKLGTPATCDTLMFVTTCSANYASASDTATARTTPDGTAIPRTATAGTDMTKRCNAYKTYVTCAKNLGCLGSIETVDPCSSGMRVTFSLALAMFVVLLQFS